MYNVKSTDCWRNEGSGKKISTVLQTLSFSEQNLSEFWIGPNPLLCFPTNPFMLCDP